MIPPFDAYWFDWYGLRGSLLRVVAVACRTSCGEARTARPGYDTAIAYWSGTFKVLGVLGILSVVFQVIALVAGVVVSGQTGLWMAMLGDLVLR
jgi:hypothetical protein